MIRRRTFGAGLLATSLPLPAIAQSTGSGGKRGGDVIVAQQAQPPSLDAQTTTAQAARNITLHVYESLYTRDEGSSPKPELAEGVDIDLLAPALAGIVLHRMYVMGEMPDEALITRVIDQIILPAATGSR